MAVKTTKKDIPDISTQRYLPFSQIKDNIMIMKDGSARVVLKCSTINFLLKSAEEQDAIIISFQRFLNSLNFPIQILIRSTKLDINWYLSNLNKLAVEQENPLLQNQTYEYIEYLKKLVEVAQIMKKEFYIIVPFDEEEDKSVKDSSVLGPLKQFWSGVFWNAVDIIKIKSQLKNFTKLKKWLIGRVNGVKTSLENIWIKWKELDKNELITFLTDYYNPSLDNLVDVKWDIENYNLTK